MNDGIVSPGDYADGGGTTSGRESVFERVVTFGENVSYAVDPFLRLYRTLLGGGCKIKEKIPEIFVSVPRNGNSNEKRKKRDIFLFSVFF